MLVQLKSIQYVTNRGKRETYYPGEWVDVGNQTARSWLATGDAVRPDMPDLQALPGCGLAVPSYALPAVARATPGLERLPQGDDLALPFPKTLWYDPAVQLRPDLIAVGFGLLDTWEVAAPLYSYQTLARDMGGDAERAQTEALVHDLRVPVYETRCLFLKRCRATRDLMAAWGEEQGGRGEGEQEGQEARGQGGDERLAFLRALYRVKPLVLALPVTWVTWVGGKK